MKVGFLGPKATFTELAVKKVFPGFELEPFRTIPESMDAVVSEKVEIAVVPIENTLENVKKIKEEMHNENMKVVATGGLGRLMSDETAVIDIYDPQLLLKGLKIIHDKNI